MLLLLLLGLLLLLLLLLEGVSLRVGPKDEERRQHQHRLGKELSHFDGFLDCWLLLCCCGEAGEKGGTIHAQELAARATELRLEREAHMQAIEHIRKEAEEQEQRHAAALEAVSLQHADELWMMQAQIQNREQFLEQVFNDMERMVQQMNKLRKDYRELKRKAQVQAERHSATLQETRAVDRRQITALKEELIHRYAQSDELIDKRRKLDDLRQQLHQANLDRLNKQHRQATERLVAEHQAQIDRMVEQIQHQEEEVAEHQAQTE